MRISNGAQHPICGALFLADEAAVRLLARLPSGASRKICGTKTEEIRMGGRGRADKLKNEVRNRPKNMEIRVPGAVLEPSGDPLGGLGVSGGVSLDFSRDLVEIFSEVGAKMSPR